jgi:hypothetical protein
MDRDSRFTSTPPYWRRRLAKSAGKTSAQPRVLVQTSRQRLAKRQVQPTGAGQRMVFVGERVDA